MLSGKFEVVVFHLLSPDEEEITLEGDWRIVDVEDGDTESISVSTSFKRQYAETVRKFRGEQQSACRRLGFHYIPVQTDFPLEVLLVERLRELRVFA